MKKVCTLLFVALSFAYLTQCKPAAEDRVKMHENAKRISDSIGKVIDDAMNEVKIEPSANQPIAVDTNKKAK